jgi:PadR family transcriptional regulator PadR
MAALSPVIARSTLQHGCTHSSGRASPLVFRWESALRCFPSDSDGENVADTPDILRGTLDLLVLKALSWGPSHGYGVARWVEEATDDALAVGEGTLYPALHRLEERGLVSARWGSSESNRRAKYYELTAAGRSQLRAETANWKRYAAAVFAALEAPALPRG